MMTRTLRLLTVATALFVMAACATNPATGRREISLMSEAQEISIGQEQDVIIRREMGVYDDAALQEYVSRIGLALAKQSERPTLPWHFTVVDAPAINAFALPGGYIYLTRGILPFLDNEAELAGVLGHEIGHVTARHSAQQYTRAVGGTVGLAVLSIFVPAAQSVGDIASQALGVLFLRYGRDDELEADRLGARYAVQGNWDPAGVPGMLSTLGRLDEAAGDTKGVPNWLSTHPDPLSRVAAIQPQVQELKAGRTGLMAEREPLLQRVDGLVFGDNPDQGIVRGSAFVHPVLRFRLDFPAMWSVTNSPTQVVSQAPGANVFMLLQGVTATRGGNIRDVAGSNMQAAGFQAVSGEPATIGGQPAFVGVYNGQLQNLGPVTVRAAHIQHSDGIYMLAGIVAPEGFRQADPTFQAAIGTFRPISAAEAAEIRPYRIDLAVARQGDSWASLAARSDGAVKPPALAIMNGVAPNVAPPVGSRVKIVVGG
jgi:predicted Zn-dependent protease